MAKQNEKAAANEVQSLFNPQGYHDIFKTWASANERMTSIAVEAGTRATDIASETAKEVLSNVRELSQVRDEPTAYGKAYADFVQKQMELFTRSAQSFADETQRAGSKTAELASDAGQEMTDKVADNTDSAAKTARSAANKAA